MYSSDGITMAEDFLDNMDPSLQFLPVGGQASQSMASFEAQLQAAMLRQAPDNPPAMDLNNVDQYMASSDLFNFDDFNAFNASVQKQLDPMPAVLSSGYAQYNPNIRIETTSAMSSPPYDTLSDQPRSSMSPLNQQPVINIPAMTMPSISMPLSATPSATMPQSSASPVAYDDTGSWPQTSSTPFTAESTPVQGSITPEKPEKKVAHNAIERRYRNNINDRIAELKSVVPALVHAKVKTGMKRNQANEDDDDDDDDAEVLDGVAVATKLNKATILRKATEYIVHLKNVAQQTKIDNAALRQIISHLPGGQEVLMRHQQLQNQHRVQQESVPMAFERDQQKQGQPVGNDNNRRKRRRVYDRRSQEDSDSSGPVTPPNSAASRIFMAAFMAVSLFATSPLTTGSVQSAADDHHHTSRTAASGTSSHDNASEATSGLLFGFGLWNLVRTLILIVGITYLLFPYLRPSPGVQYRRIARRTKRPTGLNIHSLKTTSQVDMYKALAFSLDSPPPSPSSIFGAFFSLILEIIRFFVRRTFGHDILYDGDLDEDQEWTRACTWLRMSELECVGGNPVVTRISMLHSCLKTINLIETLESNNFRSFSRAYATAAVQMALASPRFISSFCTRYFWQLAFDFYDIDDFDQDWLQIFFLDIHQGDRQESVMLLLESDVWNEALNVMRLQTQLFHEDRMVPKIKPTSTVPLEIIANFHILRKLQPLFSQLVLLLTNPNEMDMRRDDSSEMDDTRFDEILAACVFSNPARWYALVGACVEAILSDNLELAESFIVDIKDLPNHSLPEDRTIQLSIAYSLIAATQMQSGDKTAAFRVLLKARAVQMERCKLKVQAEDGDILTIENNVIMLADFVIHLLTLQTWIKLLETQEPVKDDDRVLMSVAEMNAIILSMIKNLRRMVAAPPMVLDSYYQYVLDRLCRISTVFYGSSFGDSGCECSDEEEDHSQQPKSPNTATHALRILHGLC